MSRQELRAPDAFQRVGVGAESWVAQRKTVVIGAVLALIVVGFAVALTKTLSDRKEQKARIALGAALGVLSRPIQAELPPGSTEDPAPFKSEKDRDQAAATALSGVVSSFPGTDAAVTATLPLAASEVRLGQVDQGITHYEAYLRGAPASEPLRVAALDGLGHAREAKGELPQALEAYERMAREESAGFQAGMGSFHRARILALMGKKQEAAQAFAELIAASPGTPAARLAQDRLSVLEAEGFKATVAPRPDAG
ncbi:MAG: tetratricopeptide repeat protein [Myxococcaceae bacterium]|nr:MAG: tetratricopeptide repeat protein [Myxococcaceae bacterium]